MLSYRPLVSSLKRHIRKARALFLTFQVGVIRLSGVVVENRDQGSEYELLSAVCR
jgi:hypothetical protein